ncbi:MAG: sigma-70 family RNA polymerase sigma factor [Chitinivibrionales bacterium]|nr:sigma-70 family RNA polymerase sigma factor [Chitinivibrionales bacterium]
MNFTINPSQWVEKYGDHLFNFANQRLGNRQQAQDAVQDTFLSALGSKKKPQDETQEKSWLFSILRNKIIDYYRSQAVRKHDTFDEDYDTFDHLFDEQGEWISEVKPWSRSPEQTYADSQFQKIFWSCIAKLKRKYQTTFLFRDVDGLSVEDIVDTLNISKTNFGVLIHRARTQMRSCLTNNWFEEEREEHE